MLCAMEIGRTLRPKLSLLHSMLSGKVTLVQRNFGEIKAQLQTDENTRSVVSGQLPVSGIGLGAPDLLTTGH